MLHEVLAPRKILLFHLHLGTVHTRDFPCAIFDQLDTHLVLTVLPATMLMKDGHPLFGINSIPGFRKVLLHATNYAGQQGATECG